MWAAYLLGESTLISPERWADDIDPASIAATGTTDDYCNLPTLILAKIVNLIAGGLQSPATTDINALWSNLQAWRDHRPRQALPLLRTNGRSTFPDVLHASDSSVCGSTFYHTGCLLLLRTGQVHRDSVGVETETYDQLWHANELCGVSIINTSHASWVNQVYPLYIAGQAFGPVNGEEDNEEHAAKKIALLKHLAKIERETGWPTASKAADLRRLWELE